MTVARLVAMLERLPQLYRDGELVRALLSHAAVPLEVLDEEILAVRRAHWFDAALEREEVARLAALLDIAPEDWEGRDEFRAWVHAFRDALLQHGAVTPPAQWEFARAYVERFQAIRRVRVVAPLPEWDPDSEAVRTVLVENPPLLRWQSAPATGGIEPLHQFSIVNQGLDAAPAAFLLTGLPEGPEFAPAIVNLTTGQAVIFLGAIETGKRLWMRPEADGTMRALLEGDDVTARLRSVVAVQPGTAWDPPKAVSPARTLELRPGRNDLWFLPLAHYDALGLDRFLLALADLALRQGRWDETKLDQSLFYQDPAATLRVVWTESQPACFRLDLPAGAMTHPTGGRDDADRAREQLLAGLNRGVTRMRAAGVRAEARLLPHADEQPAYDRLVTVLPVTHREPAPTAADELLDLGGLFGVTEFDESTLR